MEQNTKEKQFTSLIEEYKRVIYKICYMYATDGDNFKDLYQDVVINLWKGFEGYEGKGKPSSWIYRVGLNLTKDNLKTISSILPMCFCVAVQPLSCIATSSHAM